MWFEQGFEEDYQEVDFLKPKFKLGITLPRKNQPRSIPGLKCQNMLKLVDSFPAIKKKFWLENPVNDKNDDLVEDFEK